MAAPRKHRSTGSRREQRHGSKSSSWEESAEYFSHEDFVTALQWDANFVLLLVMRLSGSIRKDGGLDHTVTSEITSLGYQLQEGGQPAATRQTSQKIFKTVITTLSRGDLRELRTHIQRSRIQRSHIQQLKRDIPAYSSSSDSFSDGGNSSNDSWCSAASASEPRPRGRSPEPQGHLKSALKVRKRLSEDGGNSSPPPRRARSQVRFESPDPGYPGLKSHNETKARRNARRARGRRRRDDIECQTTMVSSTFTAATASTAQQRYNRRSRPLEDGYSTAAESTASDEWARSASDVSVDTSVRERHPHLFRAGKGVARVGVRALVGSYKYAVKGGTLAKSCAVEAWQEYKARQRRPSECASTSGQPPSSHRSQVEFPGSSDHYRILDWVQHPPMAVDCTDWTARCYEIDSDADDGISDIDVASGRATAFSVAQSSLLGPVSTI